MNAAVANPGTTHSAQEIAIVGMSALFPGAKDLRAYWSNILNKVNAVTEAPDDWAHPYYEPDSKTNDRVYTRKGGFLGKLAEFDPLEFGIMPNSVDGGEPDHFLALKLCWEALKDAGYLDRPFDRQKAGIILGRGTYINRGYNTLLQHGQIVDQTLDLLRQLNPNLTPEIITEIRQQLKASLPPFTAEMAPGLVPNVITGRIANRLDLMGPNYIVDAACASSLIATKLAMEELSSGRCDLVLTGGVHASTPPQINMIFCQINALSHDGIAPFSSKAGGTLLGEGLGIVVLKRLADAERDGDRIYAVLKGIGTSSDGKALGLLAPRREGEVLALERAYGESQIDPATLGLVEAHGTGIALGDRTEVQSLTQVFGPRKGQPSCALGSVKSMIGHCIPAAGSASLIKMALALHHKILPPTLCEEVNTGLEIENTPFYINTEARPWIHGAAEVPRRAGVNSFGFGGINAHAVLEEYRGPQAKTELLVSQLPTELLVFAGHTHAELLAQLVQVQQLLVQEDPAPALADLAYTLSQTQTGVYRVALVAKDTTDLSAKLKQTLEKLQDPSRTRLQTRTGIYYQAVQGTTPGQTPGTTPGTTLGKTAFIFPGEGSQYPNMLADLCCYFPQVRKWFDLLESAVSDRRAIAPSQVLFPAPTSLTPAERDQTAQILYGMDMASESVFTASMALYELLKTFGIHCDVMVGHSTGENAALIASGVVRMADPAMLMEKIRHLNQIYLDLETAGGIPRGQLLTIGALSPDAIAQILEPFGDRVHWAMDNCPNQAVLFAVPEDMSQVVAQLKIAGAICSLLPFDRAYHTSLFAGVSKAFRAFYDGLEVGEGQTPLYSCATAAPFPRDPESIRALATHQWSTRVRFRETLLRLHSEGVQTFIEVGPSANLTGFVTDVLAGKDHVALSSDSARRSGLEHLQNLLARLWVQGNPITLDPLYQTRTLTKLDFSALLATDRPKPRVKPVLTLTLPTLRLKPDFVAELRAKLCAKLGTQSPEAEQALAEKTLAEKTLSEPNPEPPVLEEVLSGLEALFEVPISEPPLPPPTPAIAPPHSTLAARSTLVQSHLSLMQSFLDQQNRVITRIYAHLAKTPEPVTASEPISVRSRRTQRSPSFSERWPLLGQVIHQDEESLQCDRHYTLDQDWFLKDHTLGGVLSQHHPELLPLPVVPFTVSMETLAEAANCLMGGNKRVIGVSNLRGYRWLSLDQGSLTINIQAKRLPSNHPQSAEVQVRLYQASAQNLAHKHLVFEGVVQLADQWQPAPAPMAFALNNPAPSRWPDVDLYRTGMFHGPRFQGVTHICGWTQEGIEAELQAIGVDNFFAENPHAEFQLDAGLLDAAGQLVGYWVSEQFGTDFNVFPFQVEAFHQYVPPPPPGHKILCRGLMHFLNPKQTTARFDFLDEQGCLIARLEGWQDRYFNIPHHYYQCRLHPQTAYLSEAWLQAEMGVVCRRVNAFPEGFLEDSWSIWQRVLAHLMLNSAERMVWYQLPETGPRRSEWLLGRIAAKDAVRQWAKQMFQLDLAPVDVEIRAVGQGQPAVFCSQLATYAAMPSISISHTKGTAIAVLTPPGCAVGIDLQCMDGLRYEDLLDGIATPKEQQWLSSLPVAQRLRCLITFWCAKESLTKALGVGLGGKPKDWEVCQYSPERSLLAITLGADPVPIQFWQGENEVFAICQLSSAAVPHLPVSVHIH